jgi:spermidine/putrescine transport system permease protein
MNKHSLLSLQFIYYGLIVFLLYLPIMVLIIFSFNNSAMITLPLKGFTLQWYQQALANRQLLRSLWSSVLVGIISGFLSTLLGTIGAIGVVRFKFPGRSIVTLLAGAPLIVPYVVVGVSLLLLFQSIHIKLSLMTVSLAHIVICIPVAFIYVAARIVGFPSNLEEASMDLGANYWETLIRVIIPLILPALVASFLTSFTLSFDEFAVTNFVIGSTATFPIYMFSQLRISSRVPMIIAFTSLIMVVTIFLLFFSERLRRVGQTNS